MVTVNGQRVYALPGVKPYVRAAANEIGNKFDVATIGGVGGRSYASDHPGGWALDFMVGNDRAKGDAIAAYTIANAVRLGVTYIIWYRRIWEHGQWKPYGGTPDGNTSPTALHMDHVHVSFQHTAPAGGGAPIDVQEFGGQSSGNPLSAFSEFGKAAKWITNEHNWLRIAMFASGIGLLIFALISLSLTKNAVASAKKAVKTVGKVTNA
jgi:hypothetical protein